MAGYNKMPTFNNLDEFQKYMFNRQPLFAVDDSAYDRMLLKLQNGAASLKTYVNYCPHNNPTHCDCFYSENILKDGRIFRTYKGAVKPVIKLSEIQNKSNVMFPAKPICMAMD